MNKGKLAGFLLVLALTSVVALPTIASATDAPPQEGGQDVTMEETEPAEGAASYSASPVWDDSAVVEVREAVEKWGALVMASVFFSGGSVCGVLMGGQILDRR